MSAIAFKNNIIGQTVGSANNIAYDNSQSGLKSGNTQDAIDELSTRSADIATTRKAGIVKPDGTTITVDADGTIHGAEQREMSATNVSFDNEYSRLQSTNVQNAIDEVNDKAVSFEIEGTGLKIKIGKQSTTQGLVARMSKGVPTQLSDDNILTFTYEQQKGNTGTARLGNDVVSIALPTSVSETPLSYIVDGKIELYRPNGNYSYTLRLVDEKYIVCKGNAQYTYMQNIESCNPNASNVSTTYQLILMEV